MHCILAEELQQELTRRQQDHLAKLESLEKEMELARQQAKLQKLKRELDAETYRPPAQPVLPPQVWGVGKMENLHMGFKFESILQHCYGVVNILETKPEIKVLIDKSDWPSN